MKHQTIISLRAENCKRLSAVEIHADGKPMVVIGGRNAQGKSSILDALTWAFAGKSSLPDQPIRQGSERATILARTQDYVIERRITAGGSTVTVRAADGSKLTTPQKVLDQLISDIAFDPLAFLRAPGKKQAEALARVVGIDLEAAAQARRDVYDERTAWNRRVKEMDAQVKTVPDDAPSEEVSVASLMEMVQEAQNAAQLRQRMEDDREARIERAQAIEDQIAALKQQMSDLDQSLATLDEEMERLPAPIDTAPLMAQIHDAERLNALARDRREQELLADRLDKARSESEALTARIGDIDATQARALAESKLPVDGLAFDGDGISLHGVPLSQASSAEQLRVSVALALAQSPGLRVCIIRDGSLLDADSLALVAQMAHEAGAQVWMERVGDGEEVSVVIEDGRVLDDRMGPAAAQDSLPASEDSSEQAQDDDDIDGASLF